MDALSHVARVLGMEWAEQTFTKMGHRSYPIPVQWPGTGSEALDIIAASSATPLDPVNRGILAYEVQRVARETWRELVSPE